MSEKENKTSWRQAVQDVKNKGAKATAAEAMLEKIINGLSDDQIEEFLCEEEVKDLFRNGGFEVPEDKTDLTTDLPNWSPDFTALIYAQFTELD